METHMIKVAAMSVCIALLLFIGVIVIEAQRLNMPCMHRLDPDDRSAPCTDSLPAALR